LPPTITNYERNAKESLRGTVFGRREFFLDERGKNEKKTEIVPFGGYIFAHQLQITGSYVSY